MRKPLLNLDTLVERPMISVDGALHEILSPDELSVLTSHMLSTRGRRMDELMQSSKLSKAEQAELTTIVREISDKVMEPVPADVREKLSDTQRMAAVEVFSTLLLRRKVNSAAATMESLRQNGDLPTGEKTSRGSSGSTEGHQDGGSTKPRSRS